MRKIPSFWIGILGCSFFAFIFLYGPYLPNIDKNVTPHSYVLGPEGNLDFILPPYEPNSHFHLGDDDNFKKIYYLLGSDKEGRDIYSALVMGTRETLTTVFAISLMTFLIAIPFGVAAAHMSLFRVLLQGWNYLFSRMPLFFYVIIVSTIPFFIFSHDRAIWMISFLIVFELGKVGEVVYKGILLIQKTPYYEAGIIAGSKAFGLFKRYYWPGCYPQWVAYFVQHLGNMLFLLGQLGIFGIFISQSLSQLKTGAYQINNTALMWPMFLFDVTIDFDAFPWVPLFGSIFITLSMFFFVSLSEGILEYNLRKQRGLIVKRKPFWFRSEKVIQQSIPTAESKSEKKQTKEA